MSYSGQISRIHVPSSARGWMVIGVVSVLSVMLAALVTIAVGVVVIVASARILPGVSVLGVPLDGLDSAGAAQAIANASDGFHKTITVMDGSRTWQFTPAQLG